MVYLKLSETCSTNLSLNAVAHNLGSTEPYQSVSSVQRRSRHTRFIWSICVLIKHISILNLDKNNKLMKLTRVRSTPIWNWWGPIPRTRFRTTDLNNTYDNASIHVVLLRFLIVYFNMLLYCMYPANEPKFVSSAKITA